MSAMVYDFGKIEAKWQKKWLSDDTYRTEDENSTKKKYYVLDMFPYPSGVGLHVGHPLGYIASDIVARYKRMQGYNVLHPMGFDSFGLPAEQYAIQTGKHPATTTKENIRRYKEQLNLLGLSYDWSREVVTSDPNYYQWTQWIFGELFNSWYDEHDQRARPISELEALLDDTSKIMPPGKTVEEEDRRARGRIEALSRVVSSLSIGELTVWAKCDRRQKDTILLKCRLTQPVESVVNWCPALGTVLSNDEVQEGFSTRGGYSVERKEMTQWVLRMDGYRERLFKGLQKLDWPPTIKKAQERLIGKSVGAFIFFRTEVSKEVLFKIYKIQLSKEDLDKYFPIGDGGGRKFPLGIFTTRPDTLYGVSFLAISPEHRFARILCVSTHREGVDSYLRSTRPERYRLKNPEEVTGVFTGRYFSHPLTGKPIQLWIADYVVNHGTGVVMGVPAHDGRDHRFAKKYGLPIRSVIKPLDGSTASFYSGKEGTLMNSQSFDGQSVKDAKEAIVKALIGRKSGKKHVNYRMGNAVFSRQRYWGEPIPIYYETTNLNSKEEPLPKLHENFPLKLPEIDRYTPTTDGKPPWARAKRWYNEAEHPYELSTMPGWAGSSWYFFRYMDPKNNTEFCSKKAQEYWKQVDLYVGGSEHAVGHLLYARFFTKFLYDRGHIDIDEFAVKLVNQGMIQGSSRFVYRVKNQNKYVSLGLKDKYEAYPLHVDVNIVRGNVLDVAAFREWKPDAKEAKFILEDDGTYRCGEQMEKMSKSKFNVINPDEVVKAYGADTFRLYEMFLGPLQQRKIWNTEGIEGMCRFLKKVWRLFVGSDDVQYAWSKELPTESEWRILHKMIKKVAEDIECLSFNTAISTMMVATNELLTLGCRKETILSPFLRTLAPFAPHIAEELWERMGHTSSITKESFPKADTTYLDEDNFLCPVSINGKVRLKISLPSSLAKQEMESVVLAHRKVQEKLAGNSVKKVIAVPGRIVNIVV